jgi:hypothetical protein
VRIVGAVVGVIGLALLVAVLLVMLAIVNQLGAAPRALGEIGANASAASAAAGRVVGDAAQSARDALDPTHPPRAPLAYDVELDELRKVEVGGVIAPHPERELTLMKVEKRVGAESPEVAQFARVRDRLKTPAERRVLGIVVSRSDDEREQLLYKAQLFRVGRALYKVNWVAFDGQQVAIGRLRSADTAVGALAFAID